MMGGSFYIFGLVFGRNTETIGFDLYFKHKMERI